MKKFLLTTITALLISTVVFAQKGTLPGTHAAPSQSTVIVMGAFSNNIILLSPADEKLIGATDVSKPVLFRWTALSPKPKESVIYRLRVWQLMQGQTAAEIIRNKKPMMEKETVNLTQTAVNNLYTGPCKPPYMCDFVWTVEAFTEDDVTTVRGCGSSDLFSFKYAAEKTVEAQGDPVHGVDVKLGIKTGAN